MKKALRQRRPRSRTARHFTVIAKNLGCDEAIRHEANGFGIKVLTKGHSTNRLYFECAERQWNDFFEKIQELCITDHAVATPRPLQKKMRQNLERASECRVGKKLAARACEILVELESASHSTIPEVERIPTTEQSSSGCLDDRSHSRRERTRFAKRFSKLFSRPVQYFTRFRRRRKGHQ